MKQKYLVERSTLVAIGAISGRQLPPTSTRIAAGAGADALRRRDRPELLLETQPLLRMTTANFTDERVAAIYGGGSLTAEERAFLIADTPNFEECHQSEAELASMCDIDLLQAARHAWVKCASYL